MYIIYLLKVYKIFENDIGIWFILCNSGTGLLEII